MDPKVLDCLDSVERIRSTVSKLLGLTNDPVKAVIDSPDLPMIGFVKEPTPYVSFTDGAHINSNDIDFISRLYFMQVMHKTYAGTASICTAVAALIDGTIVNQVCSPKAKAEKLVRIGHPSGVIPVEVDVENTLEGPEVKLAAFGRTSRRIMDGFVYVPEVLFDHS
jgi:2-methylaconitate cis-trans-isomerase PrpF